MKTLTFKSRFIVNLFISTVEGNLSMKTGTPSTFVKASIIVGLTSVVVIAACGKKKEDKSSTETAESIADLSLSSALALDLPSAIVTAAGGSTTSSLALDSKLLGKKSSEACRTMQNTNNVLERLQEIGGMFCHLEAESANMKFGTKYNVNVSGGRDKAGTQAMALWVDNSDAANLKVYMCKGGSLQQTIAISGFAGDGKAKGTVQTVHANSEGSTTHTGGASIEFDFTQTGYRIVKSSMTDTATGGDYAGSFRNYAELALADSGVSVIKMSSVGTRGSDTMSDQGVMMMNDTIGQALFKGAGSNEGNTYNYTSRATFGKNGVTVDNATAPEAIKVALSSLPEMLASTFSPQAPAGWDCSGTTETINIDMAATTGTGPAHMACEKRNRHRFTQCFGSDFEHGTME